MVKKKYSSHKNRPRRKSDLQATKPDQSGEIRDTPNQDIDDVPPLPQDDAKSDNPEVPDPSKHAAIVRKAGNKGQGDQKSGASTKALSGTDHNEIGRDDLGRADEKSGGNEQRTLPTCGPESSARDGTDGGAKPQTSAHEQMLPFSRKQPGKNKNKKKHLPKKTETGPNDDPTPNPPEQKPNSTPPTSEPIWKALYEKEKIDYQKKIEGYEELVENLKREAEETANSVEREKGEFGFHERQLKERYSELESKHDEAMKTWDKGQRKAAKLNDEYEKVSRENGELELRERHLKEQYAELESKHRKTMKTWEKEKRKAAKSNEEYETAIASLRNEIDELTVSRIESIFSIAPGLEPISQQNICESLTSLQYKIEEWARRTFNSTDTTPRPLQDLDPDIDEILSPRIRKSDSLPVGKLMELVVWGYLEQRVMSVWFPGMSPKNLQQMSVLEATLRFGDNSKSHERVDFWRSYTASLLFQNSQVHARLVDTSDKAQAIELERLLRKALSQSAYGSPSVVSSLQDIICSTMTLAAQLRCQRGVYEVDDAITVKCRFDDKRMFCLNDPDFGQSCEASRAPVRAIVSSAVVWKSCSGVGAVEEIISKARVLVDVDTDEDSFHEAQTSPHSPTTE